MLSSFFLLKLRSWAWHPHQAQAHPPACLVLSGEWPLGKHWVCPLVHVLNFWHHWQPAPRNLGLQCQAPMHRSTQPVMALGPCWEDSGAIGGFISSWVSELGWSQIKTGISFLAPMSQGPPCGPKDHEWSDCHLSVPITSHAACSSHSNSFCALWGPCLSSNTSRGPASRPLH